MERERERGRNDGQKEQRRGRQITWKTTDKIENENRDALDMYIKEKNSESIRKRVLRRYVSQNKQKEQKRAQ